eukprot:scaffold28518_cov131-Isochrysis_galbana.AAC.5
MLLFSEDEEQQQQTAVAGRRLWNASAIHPNTVKNWQVHASSLGPAVPRSHKLKRSRPWHAQFFPVGARTDICICICVPARTPYTLQHFNNLKSAFAYECPCGRQCLGRVEECHADDALTVLYDHPKRPTLTPDQVLSPQSSRTSSSTPCRLRRLPAAKAADSS